MKKSIFVLLSLVLVSCSNVDFQSSDEKKVQSTDNVLIENLNSEIILGEKIYNPYTVDEVQARSTTNEEIEPNFIYFRCRSDKDEDILWLKEKFDFLSIIPLDREIIEGGTYYNDSSLSENQNPWLYFIKPINEYNEVLEKGLITEVIEEMYMDEEDLKLLSCENLEIPEDSYLVVENENARFSWFKKIFKKYFANIPKGKIKVYDTVLKKYVGVWGCQVISNQLGVIGIGCTDESGSFRIPVPYSSLGGKVLITVRFENPSISISSTEKTSSITGAVTYYEGSHWIEGLSELNISLKDSRNAHYATVMNSYSDFCDFCDEKGIISTKDLKIWVTENSKNSCSPLLRYAGTEILATAAEILTSFAGLPLVGGSVVGLVQTQLPDLVIGAQNCTNDNYTEKIYSNMFHELSHASHYFGLEEAGKEVWINEYFDMLNGWAEQIKNGESVTGDPYNKGGTDLVKLIESWGYFSENYAMNWKYGGNTNLSRNYLNELEYNKKGDNMKHFYYGGFYDLMDDNNKIDQNYQIEKAKDFCSGFSYQNLYKALTTDAISTKEQFAEKLVDITNRENEYNNVLKTLALNCEE